MRAKKKARPKAAQMKNLIPSLDADGELSVDKAVAACKRLGLLMPSAPNFVRPALDLAFKVIFAAPKRKNLLISLINAIIDNEVTIVDLQVKNAEIPADCIEGRRVFLDILAVDNFNRKIDIEMYSGHLTTVADKNLFYMCRLHGQQDVHEHEKEKDTFGEALKATIGISILAKQQISPETPFISEYLVMEKFSHHVLSKKFQMFSMELPKLEKAILTHQAKGEALKPCHWWGKFFHTNTEEELEALVAEAGAPDVIKEAAMTLQEIAHDERRRALCNARETAILFDRQERAVNYQAGARDKQISLLSKLFAKKLQTSPSAIEEIITSQSNGTLDNLGENVFSIESIEDLKGYIKQQ